MLSVSDAEKLVHAFMTSRLDYCNALLGGCPASSINKLQIVQNAVARVRRGRGRFWGITKECIFTILGWLCPHTAKTNLYVNEDILHPISPLK